MDRLQWSRMAMLSGRTIPTKVGDLRLCVRAFLALDEQQRRVARIIVPDCIQFGRGNAVRTISGHLLTAVATMLPAQTRTS